jgi:hypothetical protein
MEPRMFGKTGARTISEESYTMTNAETGKGDDRTGKRDWIILAVLAVYTALLLLGTVGELFHVGWILNLPIFKGP